MQAALSVPPDKPPPETPETPPTTEAAAVAAPVKPMEVPPTPVTEKAQESSRSSVVGADEQQPQQTIAAEEEPDKDPARDREYAMALSKKVRSNIVYPDRARRAGLRGVATVSFALMSNGRIHEETLKVVKSSGQPMLDAGALQTIRASAPFDPPPRAMVLTIEVDFRP
jgi:protein TonB